MLPANPDYTAVYSGSPGVTVELFETGINDGKPYYSSADGTKVLWWSTGRNSYIFSDALMSPSPSWTNGLTVPAGHFVVWIGATGTWEITEV